jgi:hypothetical protein
VIRHTYRGAGAPRQAIPVADAEALRDRRRAIVHAVYSAVAHPLAMIMKGLAVILGSISGDFPRSRCSREGAWM